jgi:CBS domain containing-hemolysin-like protein
MARVVEASGSPGARVSQSAHNLIQLHVMKTRDLMTPRPVIFELPEPTRLVGFAQLIVDKPFTRIPVFRSNRDGVVGVAP